jgi:hypothetical protein
MSDTTLILIVALVSVAIGYFAGLILTTMAKEKEAEKNESVESPDADVAEPQHVFTKLDITLWSKTPNGPLLANLFGKTFSSPADFTETDRKQLDFQLNAFQSWLGKPIRNPIPPASVPVAENKPAELVPAAPAATAGLVEPGTEENQPILPEAGSSPAAQIKIPDPSPAYKPPAVHPSDNPANVNQQLVAPVPPRVDLKAMGPNIPKPAPKSIVEQIDEILQTKLTGTPFEQSGIRLVSSPLHGVDVWIGRDRYAGMENVPEGDAKRLIKAAIADWEKK